LIVYSAHIRAIPGIPSPTHTEKQPFQKDLQGAGHIQAHLGARQSKTD